LKTLEDFLALRYPIELIEDDSGGYFAKHPDLDGCFAQGETPDEAIASLADARSLWISARLEDGMPVPEPLATEPSGRFLVRTLPRIHAALTRLAQRQGVSLNQLLNVVLAEHIGRAPIRDVVREMREVANVIMAVQSEQNYRAESDALEQAGRLVNSPEEAPITSGTPGYYVNDRPSVRAQ